MPSPIQNKIGGVFIPVRQIEQARDWYCKLFGLQPDCEIMSGHLCPLPMQGAGLILDTMPMWGGKEPGGAPPVRTPLCMLLTADLEGAFRHAKATGAELVTDIEHGHWFVVRDPDGNLIMIAKE